MPGRDGTGPNGCGPRTGRGLGPCSPNIRPEDPAEPGLQPEHEVKRPDKAPLRDGRGGGGDERRFAPQRPVQRQEGPWNNGEPISEQIERLQQSLDELRNAIGNKENS